MRLSADVFVIDCTVVVSKIEAFIREKMRALSRTGVLVPLSGGLDSSTVAALCARAVGKENVMGLMLPDLKGSPDALRFGRMVARQLGIRTRAINMTRILGAAGTYRFVANLVPSRKLLSSIVRKRMAAAKGNLFLEALKGSDDPMVRKAIASIYVRQRARVVVSFHYADLNRLLVVGTAHKSEDLIGVSCRTLVRGIPAFSSAFLPN